MHAFPRGVEAAEIGLAGFHGLEGGGADGHLVEFALAAIGLDHAAHHGIGLVGAEGGEGLAIQILRGLDGGVGRQCAPNGARLLLHLQHLLDVSALQRVDAHVGQVGQGEVGHTVVHGLFGTGLGYGHDIHVKAGALK